MTRPLLLDLFCGAGGAAMGYHRAGFDVVGVDIDPQPHYPFTFYRRNALDILDVYRLRDVKAVHASPPCQFATAYKRRGICGDAVNLIPETREMLLQWGLPYVIENVDGAKAQLWDPIRCCGSSFGLDVRRHRWFESNVPLVELPCAHEWQTPRFPPATNRTNLRRTVEVGVYRIPLATQQAAMGIDWMTLRELSQAIPPAYTEHIGRQLIDHLERLNP